MANKTKALITVLVLIIVALVAVILFTLVVRPAITGYVVEKQNEGAQIALDLVIQQAARCQTVTLPIGEDQSINLVALECLQGGGQQQQQVQQGVAGTQPVQDTAAESGQ